MIAPFNRRTVRAHRDRAAKAWLDNDFLFREGATRLVDRLRDVTHRFPLALDLGCHGGELADEIFEARTQDPNGHGLAGIQTLIQADQSIRMSERARGPNHPAIVADEEFLPFADGKLDAVLSNLSLHWVNDLPGALVQIRAALRPDGLFLGSMLGGETLVELKNCLADAEIAVAGGLSPRVSPFADVRDAGALLQRAGFALPVVDADIITVSYETPIKLLHDLRAMGESNAVAEAAKGMMRREILAHAMALYEDRHRDSDGRFPATFQVITMTGWAPAETQQKPLQPGSASARLADALGVEEIGLGEKAGPAKK